MKKKGKTTTTAGGETKLPVLELSIPQQSPPPEESVLLDPHETSSWISSLPLANISETARQIYMALIDFNRYAMPVILRARVVEHFRPIIGYLCHNLRRHYMGMRFPLSQKAWKSIILSRELNNELATSFKIILQQMLTDTNEQFDRKLLIISLHRTIHYLGEVYFQSCVSYTPPPSGLWKEINLLFAYARTNRIHRIPVKMKNFDEQVETWTIEEHYKALMLFVTASPSRIRQLHLDTLYRNTFEWSSLTQFLGQNDEGSQVDTLSVNLNKDEPPIHNALRTQLAGPQVLMLDVQALVQKLQNDCRQASGAKAAPARLEADTLPYTLLCQLVKSWHSPSERRFVRTQLNFSLQLVSSLKSIHTILAQKGPVDREAHDPLPQADAGRSNMPGSTSLSLVEQPQGHSVLGGAHHSKSTAAAQHTTMHESKWDMGKSTLSLSPPEMNLTEAPLDDPFTTNTNETLEVRTRNESVKGYCIQWSATQQLPKTQVGELIGIGDTPTYNNFSLGVVRWLCCQNRTELELGLEIISSHIKAVTAYPAAAEGKIPLRNKKNPIDVLLLDAGLRSKTEVKASLLFASNAYAPGTYLWLEESTEETPQLVRIIKLIEFSGVFGRYDFDHVSRNDKKKSSSNTGRGDGFNTLRNTL